jgi:hypothetical protein
VILRLLGCAFALVLFQSVVALAEAPLGSVYVPLDSWVYPAFDRLAGLGTIDKRFVGLRPWTRMQCAQLVLDADENMLNEDVKTREPMILYEALNQEFSVEINLLNRGSARQARLESLYTRAMGISGTPLRDSFHFGQTLANDFGRPFNTGFNKEHFPSDAVVGSALGLLIARQVYRKHHDPELGEEAWGGLPGNESGEEGQNPRNLGSPYVPLDSWMYPALERLAALGYIHTEFLGMRPWTRKECARLVEEADEIILQEDSTTTEASRIHDALAGELTPELDPQAAEQSRSLHVESLYTRVLGITGDPLRDSYHFGQTLINDYGRPYAEGFNPVSGFSGWANWERFALYVRGEYQHSPSVPAYSQDVRDLIAQLDVNPVQPARPVPTINQFRLLDTYALTRLGNWNLSFGKQSLWWGPGEGGALLFSDNAEPIYMFRASRDTPFTLPWIFHTLGPVKLDTFFGKLSGNQFPPRPLLHGEKISFKPTPYLELGITRTTEMGGVGRALTPLAIFRSYFGVHSSDSYPAKANPGKRTGGLELSYKVPGLRNWLTLYYDGLDPFANPTNFDNSKSPLYAPRRAAMRSGLYVPQVPHLHKLDFRAEAVYTDPPTPRSEGGRYVYWNDFYHDLYANKGNIIGDWIGREGRGFQGWSTYWFSPRTSLQVGYRHAQVASDFIPRGDTLNDGSVKVNWQIRNELSLSAFVQYEKWLVPVLAPNAKNNVTTSLQLTFWPRNWGLTK